MWLALWACGSAPEGGGERSTLPVATERVSGDTGDHVDDSVDSGGRASLYETAETADTAGDVPPYDGPSLLSETELYASLPSGTLATGVLPYDVQYPLWSDGAEKRRYLVVPAGTSIDTSDPDHWVFPVGTVAFKEFIRDGVRVETRRFAKTGATSWSYATYLWRPDGTDADLVLGAVPDASGTSHDVPERADCASCHVGPADLFLGVSAVQLSMEQQALLPLSSTVPAAVPGEGATQAALGLIHGNCGSCHREGSLAADRSGLLLDLRVSDTDPSTVHAVTTGVGARAKHTIEGTDVVIVPGDPEASQLWVRMGLGGLNAMPPAGRELPDTEGMAHVEAWIRSIPP